MRGNSNYYVRKLNVLQCATIVSPFVVLLPGPHELLMNMRTMAGPLGFCFSRGVASEVAAALLLVKYCLIVVITAGAAPSSAVHIGSREEDCLVLASIFDHLRSGEWAFMWSIVSAATFGAGGSAGGFALSGCCCSTSAPSSEGTPETEAVWGRFFYMGLGPLLHALAEWLITLHLVQNLGSDS